MRSSDSTPLIDTRSSKSVQENESIWNRVRGVASICHPIALFTILLLCVLALLYPFWNNQSTYHNPSKISLNNQNDLASNSKNLAFHVAAGEREADRVTSLYGLENIDDYSMYSGYVTAGDERELHYWFIEATEVDPDTAPLIIWTNGGPGCSGLLGLISEQGPFWTMTGDTLTENEYAWTTIANMVFFEQPYGVGFSVVSDDDTYISGDSASADDFDAAIRSFITKFPQFSGRETYLSAESFGGHYVPTTALTILSNNDAGSFPSVNLKGFLLGNPYTDQYENTMGFIDGLYGHGLTENSIYTVWRDSCYGDYVALGNSDLCDSVYVQSYYQASNIDFYALDFDDCTSDESWGVLRWQITKKLKRLIATFKTESEWNTFRTEHYVKHNVQLFEHSDIIALSKKLNIDITDTFDTDPLTVPESAQEGNSGNDVANELEMEEMQQNEQNKDMLGRPSGTGDRAHEHSNNALSKGVRSNIAKVPNVGFGQGTAGINMIDRKDDAQAMDNHKASPPVSVGTDNGMKLGSFSPQTIQGRGGQSSARTFGGAGSGGKGRKMLNMNSGYMYEPCIMDYATTWFNLDAVQTDLNVKSTTWSKCNTDVNEAWPDSDWETFMETYYVEINERWPEFKMMIYSGDDDSVCGTHGTQYWLDNMGAYGWDVDSDNTWTAIDFGDEVGGYYTKYLNSNGERALHFHTIRSAGHMVPSTQPERALYLLKSFFDDME